MQMDAAEFEDYGEQWWLHAKELEGSLRPQPQKEPKIERRAPAMEDGEKEFFMRRRDDIVGGEC